MASGDLPDIDALWDYANPAATEQLFASVLPRARAAGDLAYRLVLSTQIARAQGLQAKYAQAHATLDEVEQGLAGDPSMHVVRARFLLERGRVFNSSGEPDRALPLFIDAWHAADAAGNNRLAIDAVHMAAIAQPTPRLQAEWNRKGIELAEARGERGWLFSLYNNLAEAHLRLDEPEPALRAFEACADLQRSRGRAVAWFVSKDIAKCLRLLGRMREANEVIRPVYDRAVADSDVHSAIYTGWELAECLLADGKPGDARACSTHVLKLAEADDSFSRHEPAAVQRLRAIASSPAVE